MYVDVKGGALLGYYLPTVEASRNTVMIWLTSLRTAPVAGVSYRVVATVFGLVVIVLSLTG
ncbi:MAG: hypothetical protein JKY64_03715 [Alcanivorax sp.]|nr:hypothetical protein [Alcanivorax sp.]